MIVVSIDHTADDSGSRKDETLAERSTRRPSADCVRNETTLVGQMVRISSCKKDRELLQNGMLCGPSLCAYYMDGSDPATSACCCLRLR